MAAGVELGALVVEAVTHFVADHRADGAIDRRVGGEVEEGSLRMAAGNTISLKTRLCRR